MYTVKIYDQQGGGFGDNGVSGEQFPSRLQAEAFIENWVRTIGQYLPHWYSGPKFMAIINEPREERDYHDIG